MMAGMLISPVVSNRANTPPINARGRLSRMTAALRWHYVNWIVKQQEDDHDADELMLSNNTRLADSSLSNWPPYSMWYPSGNFTLLVYRGLWMSFTTLRKSRPLALAEMTILRFTFSRLMVFGPIADTTCRPRTLKRHLVVLVHRRSSDYCYPLHCPAIILVCPNAR